MLGNWNESNVKKLGIVHICVVGNTTHCFSCMWQTKSHEHVMRWEGSVGGYEILVRKQNWRDGVHMYDKYFQVVYIRRLQTTISCIVS